MELAITILSFTAALVVGIIGFFVKRAFSRLDNCASKDDVNHNKNDIKDLSVQVKGCAKTSDFREWQLKTQEMSDKFASKSEVMEIKNRMEKLERGIDYIKENTVRKDDFVRLMTRLEDKIDELVTRRKG